MAFIICSLDCELKLIKLLQLSLGFTEKYNQITQKNLKPIV